MEDRIQFRLKADKAQQGFTSRFSLFSVAAVLLLVFSALLATGMGSVNLSLSEVLNSLLYCRNDLNDNCLVDPISRQIVWDIRLPRILMALITGAGLSVTGAILQSVTRNPLADPYLFGISSGASLGAVIVMAVVSTAMVSITMGALIGGAFSVLLMLVLAGRAAVQVERLLLSGVAVSFMLSAFTSLILYYSNPETAATLLFWMMGSFSNSQWNELWLPTGTLLVGVSLFFIYRRWLIAVQAGDESALTLGIPVNRLRLSMLIVCSAITAVLVAHVGGIGFVGLMIPHISRFIVGAQIHRILFMSLMLGGSFMIWVDVIARSLLKHQVLPVGIVTSAVGSFFFFVILKHRTRLR
ncbi:FecCD family ABC transporter permease [Aliikangiella coralliicola]|uniref:Iron ABC transporter permease n=1 Tax=Aliikangiella coralliicola TaxID=2592383 RepID=A0A545UJH5_9GAMM|nr:iron ABC transporter permease [Aliikangiella coralliicola]TQV89617.1 iron ABC transporter permease [Aliikangiella coralliicola]